MISVPMALAVVVFFLAAGYLEGIFAFVAFWAISYAALSYIAYRIFPPKLVVRYFGPLVTLDLNDSDELDGSAPKENPDSVK